MTVGRKPYRGAAKPKPRPAEPTIGIPGIPGIPDIPCAPTPDAVVQPAAGNAVTEELVTGAAEAQLCGTDNAPTKVARPIPADTADPPRPGDPSGLIAETMWPNPSAPAPDGPIPDIKMDGLRPSPPGPTTAKKPMSAKALVTAGLMLAGLTHCPDVNPFINVEFKKVPKADPVCPSRRFSNPEIPVVAVLDPGANGLDPTDAAGADDIGDARLCSALGTVETTCDSVDCTPVPADVPVA